MSRWQLLGLVVVGIGLLIAFLLRTAAEPLDRKDSGPGDDAHGADGD